MDELEFAVGVCVSGEEESGKGQVGREQVVTGFNERAIIVNCCCSVLQREFLYRKKLFK